MSCADGYQDHTSLSPFHGACVARQKVLGEWGSTGPRGQTVPRVQSHPSAHRKWKSEPLGKKGDNVCRGKGPKAVQPCPGEDKLGDVRPHGQGMGTSDTSSSSSSNGHHKTAWMVVGGGHNPDTRKNGTRQVAMEQRRNALGGRWCVALAR